MVYNINIYIKGAKYEKGDKRHDGNVDIFIIGKPVVLSNPKIKHKSRQKPNTKLGNVNSNVFNDSSSISNSSILRFRLDILKQ